MSSSCSLGAKRFRDQPGWAMLRSGSDALCRDSGGAVAGRREGFLRAPGPTRCPLSALCPARPEAMAADERTIHWPESSKAFKGTGKNWAMLK